MCVLQFLLEKKGFILTVLSETYITLKVFFFLLSFLCCCCCCLAQAPLIASFLCCCVRVASTAGNLLIIIPTFVYSEYRREALIHLQGYPKLIFWNGCKGDRQLMILYFFSLSMPPHTTTKKTYYRLAWFIFTCMHTCFAYQNRTLKRGA